MTLLVALGLATAVRLWPVLAARVTSGKKRFTVLNGMTMLRGSIEPDVFAKLLAGDGDCSPAVSDTASIAAMNTVANFISLGPFRMSLILGAGLLVRSLQRSSSWDGSLRALNHRGIVARLAARSVGPGNCAALYGQAIGALRPLVQAAGALRRSDTGGGL